MSKINIAEGVKREAVLNGEGQARKILLEADSLCESLDSISVAIKSGVDKSEALNLRLTEQYLEALEKILGKSSTLMVPAGSSQGMAELMTTYKHIMGSDKSQKMAQTLGGGNTEKVLQQIT